MDSGTDNPCGFGFPIRKSADQRVLAPNRGLSQRATSFIACVRQGIPQMPLLKRLIAQHSFHVQKEGHASRRRLRGAPQHDDHSENGSYAISLECRMDQPVVRTG